MRRGFGRVSLPRSHPQQRCRREEPVRASGERNRHGALSTSCQVRLPGRVSSSLSQLQCSQTHPRRMPARDSSEGGNLMPYKDPAARRRYLRDRRQRLLDSGMCGSCGVEARHKGGSFCMTCKEKSRAETVALRAEAVKAYGGKCACCGEAEAVFLNVDHVDPARYYSRRKRGERVPSGNNLLRELRARKWPAGFQILCWNCNYGKSVYGTCPHKHQDRQSHSGGPGEET